MVELFKRFVILLVKNCELKYIDKQCDKYFKIKNKLEVQQHFVNELLDRFNKKYGIDLRKLKERGGEK